MKVRDVLRELEADGWTVVRVRGSHRILGHVFKPGIIVVPGKPGDDVPPGTLRAIFRQAQMDGDR